MIGAKLTAIDSPPVADLDDCDSRTAVLNRVQDAIVALAEAVLLFTGEFF